MPIFFFITPLHFQYPSRGIQGDYMTFDFSVKVAVATGGWDKSG
jgi:hypothetical protein